MNNARNGQANTFRGFDFLGGRPERKMLLLGGGWGVPSHAARVTSRRDRAADECYDLVITESRSHTMRIDSRPGRPPPHGRTRVWRGRPSQDISPVLVLVAPPLITAA